MSYLEIKVNGNMWVLKIEFILYYVVYVNKK